MSRNRAPKRLKDWAIPIFAEDSNGFPELLKRAGSLIDPLVDATDAEFLKFDRNKVASEITTVIFNRYAQFVSVLPPGQITELTKKIKKVSAAIDALSRAMTEDVVCQSSGQVPDLKLMYGPSFPAQISSGDFPSWDALSIGIKRLKLCADFQISQLKEHRKRARNSLRADRIGVFGELYRLMTGRDCGESRNSESGKVGGPFIRFARFLENETNPFEERPAAAEGISTALWDYRIKIKKLDNGPKSRAC